MARSSPSLTIHTPPRMEPPTAAATQMILITTPISVLENPTSIMNGVNSFSENASPSLNSITSASSDAAPGVPSIVRSGSTIDSRNVAGEGDRRSGSLANTVTTANRAIIAASTSSAGRQPA